MIATVSEKNQMGSSPIGHPQSTHKQGVSKKSAPKNRAHFGALSKGSSEITPGGGTTQEQLNHLVNLHVNCKRWHVSYKALDPSGVEKRRRAYPGREKDPENDTLVKKFVKAKIFKSLLSGQERDKPVLQKINIFKAVTQMIEDKRRYLKKKSMPSIEHHLGKWKEWLLIRCMYFQISMILMIFTRKFHQ